MSNFSIFGAPWTFATEDAQKAEHYFHEDTEISAWFCRISLEDWIWWMFENDPELEVPHNKSLSSLMSQSTFKRLIQPAVLSQMHTIRKSGNKAAHGRSISQKESLHILELLYGVTAYLVNQYGRHRRSFPRFDPNLIPSGKHTDPAALKKEISRLQDALRTERTLNRQSKERQQEVLQNRLQGAQEQVIPEDPNEELTRKIFVDDRLEDAGWNTTDPGEITFDLFTDFENGTEYRCYALCGKNEEILALVEFERLDLSAEERLLFMKRYAHEIEKRQDRSPYIFLSDGYDILLDDGHFPLRKLYGFYSKNELVRRYETLNHVRDFSKVPRRTDLIDRPYQRRAMKVVETQIEQGHRGMLLMMAAGTGKTRLAASLIDLMRHAGRARKILYLAQGGAQLTQAADKIKRLLPELPQTDLRERKEDPETVLVYATYDVIIRLIDDAQGEDGRFYSVGHFDLVIFDEIHRSVFNRYKMVFDYFDALKFGMTATPAPEEIEEETYRIFGLENGKPSFTYSFHQAVEDGFLVNYKTYETTVSFNRQDIHYYELPEEQRQKQELQFGSYFKNGKDAETESPLDRWIYGDNHIDLVLDQLMKDGLKVDNGSKLGKAIIFVEKEEHALFIKKRFDRNYPQFKGRFLKIINDDTPENCALLDRFRKQKGLPVIGCSVDTLETGIDVPSVLNLVFLKPVRSSVQFWQMIGRGARLCRNLLGWKQDKKEFLILDYCKNFEYFSERTCRQDCDHDKTLDHRLFEVQLKLGTLLVKKEDKRLRNLGYEVLLKLQNQTAALLLLGRESFVVSRSLKEVERFSDATQWIHPDEEKNKILLEVIAPLVFDETTSPIEKRLNLLFSKMMRHLLKRDEKGIKQLDRLQDLLRHLEVSFPTLVWKDLKEEDVLRLEDLRQDLIVILRHKELEDQQVPVI